MAHVSVLMPVRNAAPWLGEALDSIAFQTEKDWQLVAIDDGSSDDSREILERQAKADRRILVVETDAGARGLVAALNRGLEEVRAPLLARMDADDVAEPQRLAKQADALERAPGLFAVGCRVQAFPAEAVRDGMRRYLEWQNSLLEPHELVRDRFIETPVLHPSLMMRTELMRERLGGWCDHAWPEDWDLVLRAFEAGLAVGKLADVLLRWRIHDGQASRTGGRYSEESFLAARAHYLARALRATVARDRDVWMLGAGPVGKRLGKALARQGVVPAGFADIDPKKIGGRIRDGDSVWPVISYGELAAVHPRPFGVAAVARPGARSRIRSMLATWGWVEGTDFLVAA